MSDPKNDAMVAAAFLSFMDKEVIKGMSPEIRSIAIEQCKPGDSGTIRSPLDDSKLGRFTVTDPDWTGTITNRTAVNRYILGRYPEKCETRKRITNPVEAMRVLAEIRPDLVEEETFVPDHVADSLVRWCEKAREPVGFGGELGADAPPGILVLPPRPQLRITLDKTNAVPGYRALWDAGVLSMNGEPKQIEGVQGD